jgi:CDP-6-deoxy-D-xylo-4-hexulose-3-dehydrase
MNGKWLASGENVHKFEKKFSRMFNQKYSVMVNSGSSANLVMIAAIKKVLGWEDGDEILLSPVGFPTTIAPVVQNGLKPVFVDIEFDTLNFDLDLLEEKITDRTRAIFISPVLGNPPDFDRLLEIKDKYGIKLIMDNCDSLGSKWRGKLLTDYTIASSCSFYPAHHITTGEGGMVSSDNELIVSTARSLAWWGRDCYCVGAANLLACGTCGNRFDKWLKDYDEIVDHKYIFTNMGYNLKPLDLQGAMGLVQLDKFDEIHERRRNSKNKLHKIIEKNVDGVYLPNELEPSETSWFGTPMVCRDKEQKDKLVKYFEDIKVQTRNYFAGNILLHPGYRDLDDYKKYPNSNQVLDRVFFIGASPHYDDVIFNYIEDKLMERYN